MNIYDMTDTWGDVSTTFSAIKMNVTDTASASASLLMDLQVGGSSKFNVGKSGQVYCSKIIASYTTQTRARIEFNGSISTQFYDDQNRINLSVGRDGGGVDGVRVAIDKYLGWRSTASPLLRMDDNYTLALLGSLSPTLRLYNTYTDASNYIRQSQSFTSYGGTIYAQLAAEGAGTGDVNVPFVVSPKGTGAFILGPMPDGTATGGDARGSGAVDLQTSRTASTQVASGPSAICIGRLNTATRDDTIAIGRNNLSRSRRGSACIGESNTTDSFSDSVMVLGINNIVQNFSYNAIVLGGSNLASSAPYSLVTGVNASANKYGQEVRAAGGFSAGGDAQYSKLIARNKTTDATPTKLFINGVNALLTIPSGKIFFADILISGIKSDGSAAATYKRKVAIKNVGGTTSLVGSVETIGTDHEDNASTDVAITADDTNDALDISVTGIAGETWRWVAVVEGLEIGYGT